MQVCHKKSITQSIRGYVWYETYNSTCNQLDLVSFGFCLESKFCLDPGCPLCHKTLRNLVLL